MSVLARYSTNFETIFIILLLDNTFQNKYKSYLNVAIMIKRIISIYKHTTYENYLVVYERGKSGS